MAGLADGQQVFLAIGPQAPDVALGTLLGIKTLPATPAMPYGLFALYPTDAAVIDRFFRSLAPERRPAGVGSSAAAGHRHAHDHGSLARDLGSQGAARFRCQRDSELRARAELPENAAGGRPAERNIAFGFGAIENGYTGSTYEGLWVAGVLNALQHGVQLPYGADADHIQVKRGADGLARAKRLLEATRYYSFYRLDVSDVLDYGALTAAGGVSLAARIPDPALRRDLIAYHRQPRRVGGFDNRPDDETLGRLVGKYWVALDAVGAMLEHIAGFKAGTPFDLELSIDEHPNEIPTFDCLTSETELIFVLLEAQRRGIPLTHVAPNFGVEKGTDYRGADGLPGFEARAHTLCRIAAELGVMADFHSGDDLSAAARQAIGRATAGRNHFKVSPNLQLLFAEVLADYHPALFGRWWQDSLAYAQREAAAGSAFARDCIRQSDADRPSAHDALFHNFSFAFVGRRNADGQFICREEFYCLSPGFYQAYQECITSYLLELADDLFHPTLTLPDQGRVGVGLAAVYPVSNWRQHV